MAVCNTPGSNGSPGSPSWTVNQQTGCGNLDYDTTHGRASLQNYTNFISNNPTWTLLTNNKKPASGDPSTCMAAITPYKGHSRSDNNFINTVKRTLGTLQNGKWSNLKPGVIGAGSWVGYGRWSEYSTTTCGTCLKLTCGEKSAYAIAVDSNGLNASRFMDTQDKALVEALGCSKPSASNACDTMKCSWEVVNDNMCYNNPLPKPNTHSYHKSYLVDD